MNIDSVYFDLEEKAKKLPDYINKLFLSIFDGKPVSMGTFGLKNDQVIDIVEVSMKYYYGDCELHPKKPSKDDLFEVIKMCL